MTQPAGSPPTTSCSPPHAPEWIAFTLDKRVLNDANHCSLEPSTNVHAAALVHVDHRIGRNSILDQKFGDFKLAIDCL